MSEVEDRGIRRYRAKPLEVEAIIWTGENHEAVRKFCGRIPPRFHGEPSYAAFSDQLDLGPRIWNARFGVWQALWKPGCAVMRGPSGELSVLNPDDLTKLFDEITGEAP